MHPLATLRWLVQLALRRVYYAFPAPSYYKSRVLAALIRRIPALRSMSFASSATPDEAAAGDRQVESPRALQSRPGPTRRALVIDHFTPTPDRDSGSLDVVFMIRTLQTLGYQVTFAPFDLAYHGRYTAALQRAEVSCLHGPSVISIRQHLRAGGRAYDLVLLYRLEMAALFLPVVRRHCPGAKVLFGAVDLHFLRESRQAELDRSALRRWHAQRTRRREVQLVRNADCSLVLSAVEREILEAQAPGACVALAPLQREIPGRGANFAEREGVLFIGGFQHPPNADAVRYLLGEIWPRIRRRLPGGTLHLIGNAPPADILALSGGEGIAVHGHVADLTPLFERCRVSVSPLRFGAGVKGKIGTSMSYGLPCVATSVAVEGMSLTAGLEILVADDPESFAAAVARLHSDVALWEQMSANALAFAERNFSVAAGRQRVAELLTRLGHAPLETAGRC